MAGDYGRVGLSLRGHPVEFLRRQLDRQGITRCAGLETVRDGSFAKAAGLVLLRQRPGSAKGVTFMLLEDETGWANLIVYPDVWTRFRKDARAAAALIAAGRVQRDDGGTTHLVVARLVDLSESIGTRVRSRDFR